MIKHAALQLLQKYEIVFWNENGQTLKQDAQGECDISVLRYYC